MLKKDFYMTRFFSHNYIYMTSHAKKTSNHVIDFYGIETLVLFIFTIFKALYLMG